VTEPASEAALLRWRSEFPILARSTYLISNSLGAMPRAAERALGEYAAAWGERGVRAWAEGWWEMPVRLGDLAGAILAAAPGEIVFAPNVTLATAAILSCFDFAGARRKLVTTGMEFPSLLYLCEEQRARGASLEVVESDDGVTIEPARLLEAIDSATLLVVVSHVLFRSAFIQDAAAIVRRAHQVGARVVLDVYQSAGTVPVDLAALGVDFAVGGCLKWLCGGPGAAFLYVRPDLRSALHPRLTGWMAHRDAFAFETGPIELREDGFRFLTGTPAIPALYAARPGLEIVGAVGVPAIRRKSVRQVARLIELARAAGLDVTAPQRADERGGTVAIAAPNAYEVSRELIRREFLVDYRPGAGIRVSPHFYTTDAELEAVVAEIRQILESRAYEGHRGTRSYVT
jgi:kynureninase